MQNDTTSRLAKICGMLASDHDGERASAALLATAQLKRLGHTWATFVEAAFKPPAVVREAGPTPQPEEPRQYGPRGYGIKPRLQTYHGLDCVEVVNCLLDLEMSQSDVKYVRSLELQMRGPYPGLTLRQWEILVGIARKYGVMRKSA